MAWNDSHRRSEELASMASVYLRSGDVLRAQEVYAQAAQAEETALDELDKGKVRTAGITAVSAVSLWYKAKEYGRAEALAHRASVEFALPPFAVEELRILLQTIWLDSA